MKIFISHASEDKIEIAQPLANALIEIGYDVWYDNYTLKLGDSLSQEIEKGLINCDFGIVILSKNFFKKNWPMRELSGLVSKEMGYSDKFILPIWHKINHSEILQYSVTLADRISISSDKGLDFILQEIQKATINRDYDYGLLNAEVRKVARYFTNQKFSVWAGAILWCPEIVAVFGNDGYINQENKEEKTKSYKQVHKFRKEIKERNYKELAFGTDDIGYTWAMLIEGRDARFVHDILWDCLEYNSWQRTNASTNLNFKDPLNKSCAILKK